MYPLQFISAMQEHERKFCGITSMKFIVIALLELKRF